MSLGRGHGQIGRSAQLRELAGQAVAVQGRRGSLRARDDRAWRKPAGRLWTAHVQAFEDPRVIRTWTSSRTSTKGLPVTGRWKNIDSSEIDNSHNGESRRDGQVVPTRFQLPRQAAMRSR